MTKPFKFSRNDQKEEKGVKMKFYGLYKNKKTFTKAKKLYCCIINCVRKYQLFLNIFFFPF